MPGLRPPLARLLGAVIHARQREGERAAHLLHNEVGQILSAAGLQLDVVRMDAEAGSPEIARRITEVQQLLEQAIEQVRALSYELNPAVVERAGLEVALDRLVGRYRNATEPAIRRRFDSSVRLPLKAATAMYKIAEYSLDNAVKHSGGRHVEIFVRPAGKAGATLEVRDDGAGFSLEDASAHPAGWGLLLMESYAIEAGLQFDVVSTPGKGTIVRVVYPLPGKQP